MPARRLTRQYHSCQVEVRRCARCLLQAPPWAARSWPETEPPISAGAARPLGRPPQALLTAQGEEKEKAAPSTWHGQTTIVTLRARPSGAIRRDGEAGSASFIPIPDLGLK